MKPGIIFNSRTGFISTMLKGAILARQQSWLGYTVQPSVLLFLSLFDLINKCNIWIPSGIKCLKMFAIISILKQLLHLVLSMTAGFSTHLQVWLFTTTIYTIKGFLLSLPWDDHTSQGKYWAYTSKNTPTSKQQTNIWSFLEVVLVSGGWSLTCSAAASHSTVIILGKCDKCGKCVYGKIRPSYYSKKCNF